MIINKKIQGQNASSTESRGNGDTYISSSNVMSLSVVRQRREDAQTRMKAIKILEAASKLGW